MVLSAPKSRQITSEPFPLQNSQSGIKYELLATPKAANIIIFLIVSKPIYNIHEKRNQSA